jgi:hypothetical protein
MKVKESYMKKLRRQIALGTGLIMLSALMYFLQIRVFHSGRDTLFYLLQDLAFVPIQLLLVTVIVDQVLRIREKAAMLNKLNMVIGTFFSEAGTRLLRSFSGFDHHIDRIRPELLVKADWPDREFDRVLADLQQYDYHIDVQKNDLGGLKLFLSGKRDFLLRLLENPNLLEHETFTELLWAVFHLTEELEFRTDLAHLSAADREHIALDIRRAYVILISEWLSYMRHLKKEYPYLFSLAVRTNPFDERASSSFQ